MRLFPILAASLLALHGCAVERTVKTAPVVVGNVDLDMAIQDKILLHATAIDADGTVESFTWKLVEGPQGANPVLAPKTSKGDIVELQPGGVTGLYVLSVTATDDQGLTSDPDFVNVMLRPQTKAKLALSCTDGCVYSPNPEADEATELTIQAILTEADALGFSWTAALKRDPADPLTGEPVLTPNRDQLKVSVPRVARAATLTVHVSVAVAGGQPVTQVLSILVKNNLDEPPVVSLDWHLAPDSAAPASDVAILPGDAIHVTATASDPNGDPLTCEIKAAGVAVEITPSAADPCRVTVYPLEPGTLSLTATASTASPQASTDSAPLQMAIKPFAAETSGPSLTAVAVRDDGSVLAGGSAGQFYLYQGGQRLQFSAGGTTASAVALSHGRDPDTGMVGFADHGSLSRYNLKVGSQESSVSLPGPTATRALAAGSAGRIFAATDSGVLVYSAGGASLAQFLPTGGLNATAVTVGPNPKSTTGEGIVWYAEGANLYFQTGEDQTAWGTGKGQTATTVANPAITALAAGPAGEWDLWVATGPSNGGTGASSLLLFKNSLDPASGAVQLNGAQALLAQQGSVAVLAVEAAGRYQADVWAVAGGKLLRVSRAPINDVGNPRGVKELVLGGLGGASARGVAVAGRKVAVATNQGLLTVP